MPRPARMRRPLRRRRRTDKPDAPRDTNGDPYPGSQEQQCRRDRRRRLKQAAGDSDSIVATVNDESISDFELRQRVALYLALNGFNQQQLTAEQKTRMRSQILEQLEAEKVQLQEAVKKKITVSPVEVDKRLNAMMQDYHFTIEQLRQNLTNAGASEEALRAQITASHRLAEDGAGRVWRPGQRHAGNGATPNWRAMPKAPTSRIIT